MGKVTEKNVNISKICMFFLSHYGGGKGTVEYQGMLKDAFINRFNVDESNFVQNYAAIVKK